MIPRTIRRLPALLLILVVAACGEDGGNNGAEPAATDTAAELDTSGAEEAPDDDPSPESAGGADAPGDSQGDEGSESTPAAGGASTGTVTVDGTTHEMTEVLLCEPPDGVRARVEDVDGVDELESLNLRASGSAGTFLVHLADFGTRTLEVSWDDGAGTGRLSNNYADVEGGGQWIDAHSGTAPDGNPIEVGQGRASGAVTLVTADDQGVAVAYDLDVPATPAC